MKNHRKVSPFRKATLICRELAHRETFNKTTSMYALAKALGYTNNGSFTNSVWSCVDQGLIDARPAGTCGGRFAWQLILTKAGWERAR